MPYFRLTTSERAVGVQAIILINIAVLILWFVPMSGFRLFMAKNFLVSSNALMEGRVWTLLTSFFSHNLIFHIFINMYVLYGFGTVLENALGLKKFMKFYIIAGLVSTLSHCLVSSLFMNKPELPALGASGAISGVIFLFSLMYPNHKIYILGLIPAPALFAAITFVGIDIWGLMMQTRGGTLPIGHGAHLGGALVGLLYFFFILRPRSRYNTKAR